MAESNIIEALNSSDASVLEGASCAFGVFDGVHKGHRFLIDAAIDKAKQEKRKSVIITFSIDPDELFGLDPFTKIMSNDDRIEALAHCGADYVLVLSFNRDFAAQSPFVFMDSLFGEHTPSSLHVGNDVRFGSRAAGSIDDLRTWGVEKGMDVHGYELILHDGLPITATRIRAYLSNHEIKYAEELLGHSYYVTLPVIKGRGEGEGLGFPTANIETPDNLFALHDGVYGGYAIVDDNCYKAAINIGIPPFAEGKALANCEVNLLDFSGNLYGVKLRLVFKIWIRPMRKFNTADELSDTIAQNVMQIKKQLSCCSPQEALSRVAK